MNNPIVGREFVGMLRRGQATALLTAVALFFSLLVLARWPSGGIVDLSAAQSAGLFRLFGYGLLATLLILVPVFPATSIVREKAKGTLVLLLNSPMPAWSIYLGKISGVLGFVALILVASVPAAAACYAMGGVSLTRGFLPLYGLLFLVAMQYVALGLLVSTLSSSTESAMRITYGCVLLMTVISVGPHFFLQGKRTTAAKYAALARCVSPIPAVMELMGDGDVGGQGLINPTGVPFRFAMFWVVTTAGFASATLLRLNHTIFDRARSAGRITDDQSALVRVGRRMMYLVDPQRRKTGIPWYLNPVMVKEFRCRRFGRMHWLLRLVAVCAVVSLWLTYAASTGMMTWGPAVIGGIMVMLQVALIIMLAPALAGGLISGERESGGWQLLQMTPISPGRILRGKLMSVVWPVCLLLFATLPGYAVMYYIRPEAWLDITYVIVCLLLTAAFSIVLAAACSSLFSRTSTATTVAYAVLITLCVGTLLIWMGRGAPFGHATVEAALSLNPMAAALNIIKMPGFAEYRLVETNWWLMGSSTLALLGCLFVRCRQLSRPQ